MEIGFIRDCKTVLELLSVIGAALWADCWVIRQSGSAYWIDLHTCFVPQYGINETALINIDA